MTPNMAMMMIGIRRLQKTAARSRNHILMVAMVRTQIGLVFKVRLPATPLGARAR